MKLMDPFRQKETIEEKLNNLQTLWFDINEISINYIAFEPSPVEFECLKFIIQDSEKKSICYNIGLWNKDHNLSFYLSSQNADSSFIEHKEYQDVLTINAERLDNYINSRN